MWFIHVSVYTFFIQVLIDSKVFLTLGVTVKCVLTHGLFDDILLINSLIYIVFKPKKIH